MFACDSVVLHRKSLSFYLLDQIFCKEKTEKLSNLTESQSCFGGYLSFSTLSCRSSFAFHKEEVKLSRCLLMIMG